MEQDFVFNAFFCRLHFFLFQTKKNLAQIADISVFSGEIFTFSCVVSYFKCREILSQEINIFIGNKTNIPGKI